MAGSEESRYDDANLSTFEITFVGRRVVTQCDDAPCDGAVQCSAGDLRSGGRMEKNLTWRWTSPIWHLGEQVRTERPSGEGTDCLLRDILMSSYRLWDEIMRQGEGTVAGASGSLM